jgi:hypothetical protein
MTRLGVVFWLGLVLVSGFTTFKVKHAVQEIDDELNRVRKHVTAEQQETRVLAAEWTYLNQPERLAELNRIFLQLGPMATRQLQQRIEDIPLRPGTPGPDILVAAAPPVAAPPVAAPPVAAASIAAAALPVVAPPAAPVVDVVAAAAPARAATPTSIPASAPPLRAAKATAGSLDALIAQIADRR